MIYFTENKILFLGTIGELIGSMEDIKSYISSDDNSKNFCSIKSLSDILSAVIEVK